MKIISLVLISIALIFFSYPHLALAKSHKNHNSNSNIINVKNLGAVRDGKTDSSAAFLSAWNAACKSESPSTIIIPTGTYAVNQALVFRGKDCKSKAINFVVRGTMVAPTDFRVLGKSDTWFAFEDVTGVSISGGVFDGRGASLWACKRSGKKCPRGATVSETLVNFNHCLILLRLFQNIRHSHFTKICFHHKYFSSNTIDKNYKIISLDLS